jgi:L-threonylcarbamoyladenylate synthase
MNQSYPQAIDVALQDHAVSLWNHGGLVAFPTETVYGLGADARNGEAVAAIFTAKDRPRFNPLIVHVATPEISRRYVQWSPLAEALAAAFLPGPLTLVLPKRPDSEIHDLVSAGGATLGIRIPAHPIAQQLLRAFDGPIAAPSANRSGRISPTTAAHVQAELGDRIPLIIDGGPCQVGLESTVVDCSGESLTVLRSGAITREMLARVAGPVADAPASAGEGAALLSPGQLASHYAPEKPLRLNATSLTPGEALLAFGPNVPQGAVHIINLSATGDLIEAAANLFAALRALDASPATAIAAMSIPQTGIGEAINDRLSRASAPR